GICLPEEGVGTIPAASDLSMSQVGFSSFFAVPTPKMPSRLLAAEPHGMVCDGWKRPTSGGPDLCASPETASESPGNIIQRDLGSCKR
ncbi:Hypothetical protein FKW44_002312, partial [Caligus rogercresseyi]